MSARKSKHEWSEEHHRLNDLLCGLFGSNHVLHETGYRGEGHHHEYVVEAYLQPAGRVRVGWHETSGKFFVNSLIVGHSGSTLQDVLAGYAKEEIKDRQKEIEEYRTCFGDLLYE